MLIISILVYGVAVLLTLLIYAVTPASFLDKLYLIFFKGDQQ